MAYSFYYPFMWLVIGALVVGLIFINIGIAYFNKTIAQNPTLCDQCNSQLRFLGRSRWVLWLFTAVLSVGGLVAVYADYTFSQHQMTDARNRVWPAFDAKKVWETPDPYLAQTDAHADLIAYGRDLVAHTQDYFGENGLVKAGSINGLNCQNCHLDAGGKPFGNNYFAVASTYPQMRARSGALETIPKRINDCFQRSLNGEALDSTSREMRAMVAYMEWLGTGVPKGQKPKGAGLVEVPFLQRPADPQRGQLVYTQKCASCHGNDGNGLPIPKSARDYPPLWGDRSYNEGAGLFRMSRFAGYVKTNMPFGANYQNPQLTDEEAWDVAAYVNAQPRPKHPFLQTDWPKIEKKPFDHPFGPFADTFPEAQHKFGPFEPIIAFYKAQQKK